MKSAVSLAFALSLSTIPVSSSPLPSPLIVPRQSFVLCASRNSGTISVALNKELMNTNCGWWRAYIFPDVYHVYRERARARASFPRNYSISFLVGRSTRGRRSDCVSGEKNADRTTKAPYKFPFRMCTRKQKFNSSCNTSEPPMAFFRHFCDYRTFRTTLDLPPKLFLRKLCTYGLCVPAAPCSSFDETSSSEAFSASMGTNYPPTLSREWPPLWAMVAGMRDQCARVRTFESRCMHECMRDNVATRVHARVYLYIRMNMRTTRACTNPRIRAPMYRLAYLRVYVCNIYVHTRAFARARTHTVRVRPTPWQ